MEFIRVYSIWLLGFANLCLVIYALRGARE
jgi:hypothetical protein